jgi:hypothetical protein
MLGCYCDYRNGKLKEQTYDHHLEGGKKVGENNNMGGGVKKESKKVILYTYFNFGEII